MIKTWSTVPQFQEMKRDLKHTRQVTKKQTPVVKPTAPVVTGPVCFSIFNGRFQVRSPGGVSFTARKYNTSQWELWEGKKFLRLGSKLRDLLDYADDVLKKEKAALELANV